MSPENEKKLLEAFPELYSMYDSPPTESCMCWGFEVPDEWFDVLWWLSEQLHNYSREHNIEINAAQVKEKFGTLRFYLEPIMCSEDQYRDIYDFITFAETKILSLHNKGNK